MCEKIQGFFRLRNVSSALALGFFKINNLKDYQSIFMTFFKVNNSNIKISQSKFSIIVRLFLAILKNPFANAELTKRNLRVL
jgi:hypothetical protein